MTVSLRYHARVRPALCALALVASASLFAHAAVASLPTRHLATTTVRVTIQNFSFVPRVLAVAPGTTVVWTQRDSVGHTVASDDNSWGQSPVLNQGDTFRVTLLKAGTYAYHCSLHPDMKGTIVVAAGATGSSGTGSNSSTGAGMGAMGPMSTARLMAWTGYYDARKVLYISTDTSSKAEALRDHINYAPALAKSLPSASQIYLVTNGALAARGPVFGSTPGKDDYTPLWQEVLVTWKDPAHAVALTGDDQIKGLAKSGKVTLTMTGVVLNCPIITGMTAGKM